MSGDKRWLREEGFPLMEKVAEFWVSRVEKNEDGSYSIRNVVCADEYAEGVLCADAQQYSRYAKYRIKK